MLLLWSWTLPKGIEAQTKKLFEVVNTWYPVFTFMNKLDRDGREPLDLLQRIRRSTGIIELPDELANRDGKASEGLWDLYNQRLELYKGMSVFKFRRWGQAFWEQPLSTSK